MDFKLFYLLAICTVAICPTFVTSKLITDGNKIYLDDKWLVVKLEGSNSYGEKDGQLYGCKVDRELNTDEQIQAKEARLRLKESMVQMTDNLNKDFTPMNWTMKRDNNRDVSKMNRQLARNLAKMNKKMKQDAYRYEMKMQRDVAKMNRKLALDMAIMNRNLKRDINPYKGRKNIKKNKRRAKVNQGIYEGMNYDADEDMNPEMGRYTSPKKGRKNRKINKNAYTKQGMFRNGIGNNNNNVFNSNNVVNTNSDNGFNMDSLDSDMQKNVSKTNDDYLEGDMGGKKSSRKNNKKSRKNNKKSRKSNKKNNKKNKRTANTKFVKTTDDIYDIDSGNNNVVTSISDVNSNNDSNNFGNTAIVDTEQNMDQNIINTYQDMDTGDNTGNTIIAEADQNIAKTNNDYLQTHIYSNDSDKNNEVISVINNVNSNNDSNNFGNTAIVDTEQNMDQNMAKMNQYMGQDSSKTYTDVNNMNEDIAKNPIIGDNVLTVVNTNNLDNSNSNDAGNGVDNIVSISNDVNNNNNGVGKVVANIVNTVDDVNSNNTGNNSVNTLTVDTKQSMDPKIDQNVGDVEGNVYTNKTGKSNKKRRTQTITRRVIVKKGTLGNNKGNIVNNNNVVETINDVNNNDSCNVLTVDPEQNIAKINLN